MIVFLLGLILITPYLTGAVIVTIMTKWVSEDTNTIRNTIPVLSWEEASRIGKRWPVVFYRRWRR